MPGNLSSRKTRLRDMKINFDSLLARVGLCRHSRLQLSEAKIAAMDARFDPMIEQLKVIHQHFIAQNNALKNLETEHKFLLKREEYLRAQLMNIRVQQATEGRTGWELLGYIPTAVLDQVRRMNERDQIKFTAMVAFKLIDAAIKGIFKVDAMGKCNALVFAPIDMNKAPAAPKHVQVLFEKKETGAFEMSKPLKLIEPESEETRVRNASK